MSRYHASYMFILVFLISLPALVSAEQVTITGQVLGPDAQPVADAQVLLRYVEVESGSIVSSSAVANAAGRFFFSVEITDTSFCVWVAAHKPGLAANWATVFPGGNVTLKLGADPVSCAGVVTDADGNPIAGAQVSVRVLERPWGGEGFQGTLFLEEDPFLGDTTDQDGRFEVVDLPARQRVYLTAVAEDYGRLMLCDSVRADSRDNQLVLHPEAIISGRVTHNGQPMGGLEMFCCGSHLTFFRAKTVSADDGTYRLGGLPADVYIVMAEAPKGLTAPAIEDLRLKAGEHRSDADFELTAGGLVTGMVTFADTGQPAPGARIFAYGPARPGASSACPTVSTDETGTYTLRLAAGSNSVYYQGGVGNITFAKPIAHRVEVGEGETLTGVDFVLRPQPRLHGQVVLPDGEPAAGVEVGAVSRSFLTPIDGVFRAQTDGEGNFDCEAIVGSRNVFPLVVVVREVERSLAGIAFVDEPETPLQIRLQEAVYLVGSVLDTEDNPVSGVFVKVRVVLPEDYHGVEIQGACSDEEGRLRIGPLPPRVPLRVAPAYGISELTADEAWRPLEKITLGPGEEHELPPLRLNLQRRLKGWVGDNEQQPVAGAVIFASGDGGLAYADERGYFALTGLPARGKVKVVGVHPVQPLFAATELDPDWGFRANLILQPLGGVTGRVIDERGQPVSGHRVSLGYSQQYVVSEELRRRLNQFGFQRETVTDDEGKWRLGFLIPGADYRVRVYPPKSRSALTYAEFTAQAGETMDLGEMRPRPDPEAGGPGPVAPPMPE